MTAAICLFAVGLIAGLLADANADDKQYKIEYKLKKGTGFAMATTNERKAMRNMMGNEIKSTTTDVIKYVINVTEAKDGKSTVSVTYKERTQETDDPQVQLDTDFSELLGKKGQFMMTSRGVMSDFVGFDALPEIAISGGQATRGGHQYINELKEFFIQLPEKKIAIGGTWSYTEEFNEPVEGGSAKIVVEYTFTLTEALKKDDFNCLKLVGEYTTTVSGTGAAQGMEYTLEMTGKGTETVLFEQKMGMLLESVTESFVEGAVVAEDVGFEMPMRHDYVSKRTFTLK
jgi:hypothetical protein